MAGKERRVDARLLNHVTSWKQRRVTDFVFTRSVINRRKISDQCVFSPIPLVDRGEADQPSITPFSRFQSFRRGDAVASKIACVHDWYL